MLVDDFPPFYQLFLGFEKFERNIINTLFIFTDDDSRVKLYKGKNDYINANYVTVSNTDT